LGCGEPGIHDLCAAGAALLGSARTGIVRRDLTMPTNKDFKKLVRARMSKTGEAYTAARAHLLRGPAVATVASAAPAAAPAPPPAKIDYATLAGISDAAVKNATGCEWEKWVWVLDRSDAGDLSHRALAEQVQKTWKVSDWWAQTVAVGYERIKGRRAIGQRLGGAYEATKSKTIAAPAAKVYKAFADMRQRRKWLPATTVTVRKGTPGKSLRMTWDDGTSVEVWLTPKGAKTQTAVAHRKLSGKDDADRRKAFWSDKLGALASVVEAGRAR
jgi:uncharacterized protein YndB with AHSA1/START domain